MFTLRGMSPLHLLGAYGKDNSSQILDLFKAYINNFDLGNILSLGRVIIYEFIKFLILS